VSNNQHNIGSAKKVVTKRKKTLKAKKKNCDTFFCVGCIPTKEENKKKQKLESEKGLKSFPSFFIVSAFLIVSGYFSQTILL
jgi:hypothetical protein